VTEAMSGLMTDGGRSRRKPRPVASLLNEAWSGATRAVAPAARELAISGAVSCDIDCEERATTQGLEHLFREALRQAASGAKVTAACVRRGGGCGLEIRVQRAPDMQSTTAGSAGGDNLRTMLARMLLQMQGATVACRSDGDTWVARVAFAARA
jgi:hypothetical protein